MEQQQNKSKVISLIVFGTILEYYDFLLFAHLGFIITPLFFPDHSSTYTHILSLLLFGLSFIIRPIGGYIFGLMSDKHGRKTALIRSVKWAIFPSLGLAFLPNFESIGIIGSLIFVFLRLMQGIALGGEYPVAGIYLMETKANHQGLISSIIVASGSVGSLIALLMAVACMQPWAPEWLWRVAFFMGGTGSYLSYKLRNYLSEFTPPQTKDSNKIDPNIKFKRFLVVMIGLLIGVTVWLPMTYSNFYVTKILHLPVTTGLYASFIAIITYILALPFIGLVYDAVNQRKYMIYAALLVIPTSIFCLYLLTKGYIVIAQIGFTMTAAIFGGPLYKLIYSLFSREVRGRNIGILLMSGLSFGGMFPSLAGFIVAKTGWDLAPSLLISLIAFATAASLYKGLKLN